MCSSIVLPRSRALLVRVDGQERFLDPSVANVEKRGQELHVSYLAGVCGPAPRGELVVIEGSGHSVQRRYSDGAQAVTDFLLP